MERIGDYGKRKRSRGGQGEVAIGNTNPTVGDRVEPIVRSEKAIPKIIYLQIVEPENIDLATWCVDKINDDDIEYVRKVHCGCGDAYIAGQDSFDLITKIGKCLNCET